MGSAAASASDSPPPLAQRGEEEATEADAGRIDAERTGEGTGVDARSQPSDAPAADPHVEGHVGVSQTIEALRAEV